MKSFTSPDGTRWRVEARVPGASNAMIVFHHPGGSSLRKNRYGWVNWHGPEARNVTARLLGTTVLESLDDAAVAMLFRRSVPVVGFGEVDGRRGGRPPALGALGRRVSTD